jgi:hypothetical protein
MRFKPFGRYEFNDTSRKRAAYRRQYAERLALGFEACLDYYRANLADAHPFSDKTPKWGVARG